MRTFFILAYVLWPALLFGSPASALREYKAGQYDQALKEYEQLLRRKSDDPRVHFNAGAAAYRNRQFEQAAKQFEAAQTSPDLNLQSRAYYNRGNSLYYLGDASPDPSKKTEAWEQALKAFQSTVKLDPKDGDARFNQEFVRKKLEELKKQQQQSPSSQNIQPSEAAKKAKAEADAAVSRRQYSKALEIMEKQLEQDSTTSYYSDFVKKLKEVTDVQDSAKH